MCFGKDSRGHDQRLEAHDVVMHVNPNAEARWVEFLDFAFCFDLLHAVVIISPCGQDFNISPEKENSARQMATVIKGERYAPIAEQFKHSRSCAGTQARRRCE